MILDLKHESVSANSLRPVSLTGTAQGVSADFANATVSMGAVIDVGAVNGTSCYFAVEESATGTSAWSEISGMNVTVTTSNTHSKLFGLRAKRYVRVNAKTFTGTTFLAGGTLISQARIAGSAGDVGGFSLSPASTSGEATND